MTSQQERNYICVYSGILVNMSVSLVDFTKYTRDLWTAGKEVMMREGKTRAKMQKAHYRHLGRRLISSSP